MKENRIISNIGEAAKKATRGAIKKTPFVAGALVLGATLSGCCPDNVIIHDATPTPSAATGTPRPTTPDATPTPIARVDVNVNVNVTVDKTPAPATIDRPKPAEKPAPTSTPTESPEIAQPVCLDADQIGIWAPSKDGKGETFEIDSTDSGTIILANVWFPNRSETSVEYQLILNGRRIQIIGGAGTAWKYKTGCSMEEVQRQGLEHEKRREANGTITHKVTVEELDALFPDLVRRLPGDSTLR